MMEIDSKEELEYKIAEMRKTYDGNGFTKEQVDKFMETSVSFLTAFFEESELNKKLDENDGGQTGEVLDRFMDFIDRTYFDNDEDKEMLQRTAEEIVYLSETTDDLVAVMDHRRECYRDERVKADKIEEAQSEEYVRACEHAFNAAKRYGLPIGSSLYENVDALCVEIEYLRTEVNIEQSRIDDSIGTLFDYDGWYDEETKKGDAERLAGIIDEVLKILNGDLKGE